MKTSAYRHLFANICNVSMHCSAYILPHISRNAHMHMHTYICIYIYACVHGLNGSIMLDTAQNKTKTQYTRAKSNFQVTHYHRTQLVKQFNDHIYISYTYIVIFCICLLLFHSTLLTFCKPQSKLDLPAHRQGSRERKNAEIWRLEI